MGRSDTSQVGDSFGYNKHIHNNRHCRTSIVPTSLGDVIMATTTLRQAILTGIQLQKTGRTESAEQVFRQILDQLPDHVDARHLLGAICFQTNRFEEAVEHLQRVLQLKPDLVGARNNLAATFKAMGHEHDAEVAFREVLAADANHLGAAYGLAQMLSESQVDETIDLLNRVVRSDRDHYGAHNLLGQLLFKHGDRATCVKHFEHAATIRPDDASALCNLVLAYHRFGHYDQALETLKQLFTIDPKHVDGHHCLAQIRLMYGDFESGLYEYEWRVHSIRDWLDRDRYDQPTWDGTTDANATLLLHTEQGLGDCIQCLRYVPMIAERVGRVIVESHLPALNGLLRRLPGIDSVYDRDDELPPFDYRVTCLSLPYVFKSTLTTIPADVPYLFVDDDTKDHVHDLVDDQRLRVGINWQGNPNFHSDRFRSVSLSTFDPLAAVAGIAWFSLQHGDIQDQLDASKLKPRNLGAELDRLAAGVATTRLDYAAAAIKNMDLIITTDTMLAHLAGSLGCDVWVLLPTVADWRWLMKREDSPWYPTMRLFRQTHLNDWQGVFERVADALRAYAAGDRTAGQASIRETTPPVSRTLMPYEERRTNEAPTPEAVANLVKQAFEHHRAGNADAAERCYRSVLEQDPDNVDALHLLGLILYQREQTDEGIKLIRQAINGSPKNATMHANLAAALTHANRLEEAVDAFRQTLAIQPNQPKLWYQLGDTLSKLGRSDDAIEAFKQAVAYDPDYFTPHYALGMSLRTGGRPDEAEAFCRKAIKLRPESAGAWTNLGNVHQVRGDFDEALKCYRHAIELDPEQVETHNNIGTMLVKQNQPGEAVSHFQRAIELRSDYAEAHHNLGMAYMMNGDYANGWSEMEWRWQSKDFPSTRPVYTKPVWNGEPLEGKRVLIHGEQGLGDTIQFIRYARHLVELGGRVLLKCNKYGLRNLLANMPWLESVVDKDQPTPAFDVEVPIMSLPRIFDTRLDSIPSDMVPYLHATQDDVTQVKSLLAQHTGPRIGLNWQGSATFKGDATRSIPLRRLMPLSSLEHLSFISLQHGEGMKQLDELPGDWPLFNLGDELDRLAADREDSGSARMELAAAALSCMDLVITSCTMPAHLAGALGCKTWVLLQHSPDWRWMLDRNDSPWYPTLRLFRQPSPGDWGSVITQVRHALIETFPVS